MTDPITNTLPDGSERPIMTGEMIAEAQKLDVVDWIEANVPEPVGVQPLLQRPVERDGVRAMVKPMPTQVATWKDRITDPWHASTTFRQATPGVDSRLMRGAIDEISADEWKPNGDRS